MAEAATYETVLIERDGGVAVVTLNRPEQLDAFNPTMTEEMQVVLQELDDDDDVRAIVVTGAGRAFSAGADVGGGAPPGSKEGLGGSDPDPAPALRPWDLRTPIIAAINGAAVGMGITWPLMWDIRIAAEDAKIGLVFVRRGLVPEGNCSWLLSRLIGASAALELLLTGRIISGKEAAELGMVTRAVPHDDVLPAALAIAHEIATHCAPAAVGATKRLFYRYLEQTDRWDARVEELEVFRWMGGRPDAGEGVRSFLERRDPVWADISRDDLPPMLG